jgi:hypothetical protein
MSTEVLVKIRLDWTAPGHYDPERPLPYRCCSTTTKMRDDRGAACHQTCAEDEIARELLGLARDRIQVRITDERFRTPTQQRKEATR